MIVAVVLVIGGYAIIKNNGAAPSAESVANVSVVDGQQIIDLTAKGGFSPTMTSAAAGVPSVLRVATNGTYDCSSAITIPSLGYSANLPPSGTTNIEIPPQLAGTTLQGTCSMGMYNFAIAFN